MKTFCIGAMACIGLISGGLQAATIGFTFSGTAGTGNDNLHLYTQSGGAANAGPVVVSVSYDPTQLTNCQNFGSSDYSYCTAPTGAGSVSASFTTTDLNNVTHIFTESGGAPLLNPVSCPEGFCSDTGGGIHMYNSAGTVAAQFYAFGPDGHYLAGGWNTNLAWQPNVSGTNQNYASQMLASITSISWFYSGEFTSESGGECSDPGQGPYCAGPNFAPGDYYGQIGDLAAVTVASPEPATVATFATGLLCVAVFTARRRKLTAASGSSVR